MDKLQEIKNRFSIATSLYKKKIDVNWSTILEDQEFLIQSVEKQREIIEENKRQQEVTVHQFRQTREELQRLSTENEELKLKVEKQAESIRDFEFENGNLEDEVEELQGRIEALEGDAE
ncbi:VWA domain-containing protein [Bacillus subtilis]|uniref:VWA domain-containing protein n=1 Tax=Bacillus subtilis TaxID=1423 RepID=UPI003F87273B